MKSNKLIVLFFSLILSLVVFAKPNTAVPSQVMFQVLQAPTPLLANNQTYLVYEVNLTNFNKQPVKLDKLQISSTADAKQPLFEFDSNKLKGMIKDVGKQASQPKDPLVLLSGRQKILFVWLPFKSNASIPSELFHTLQFKPLNGEDKFIPVKLAPVAIEKTPQIVIAPPLKGDMWAAMGGPSNSSYHRRADLVLNGQLYFSQRYAIDFVQIGTDGKTYHGAINKNVNYYCYGQPVFAVANGKVVAVTDNIPENVPNSGTLAVPITLKTVGGNEVILDIGNGLYAVYGHLIPGSIKVHVGEQVKQGQMLAKLGNSGNSTEPHLHFQIMDRPDTLAANGLPYVYNSYELYQSKSEGIDATFQAKLLSQKTTKVSNQLMLENAVVKFNGDK